MATARKPVRKAVHTVATPAAPRDLEKFVRSEVRILTDAVMKMEKELEKFLTRGKPAIVRHAAPRPKRAVRTRTLAVKH